MRKKTRTRKGPEHGRGDERRMNSMTPLLEGQGIRNLTARRRFRLPGELRDASGTEAGYEHLAIGRYCLVYPILSMYVTVTTSGIQHPASGIRTAIPARTSLSSHHHRPPDRRSAIRALAPRLPSRCPPSSCPPTRPPAPDRHSGPAP